MGQLTQFFQPPLYWQQFEDLTQSIFQTVYGVVHADKIGRPGQTQHGVDVYGSTVQLGGIGVQCKRLDDLDENNQPFPGGPITRRLLETEAKKALAFSPRLSIWILATTAKRDAAIQQHARELDQQYQKRGKFQILLWFWDDYVAWLNARPDLQRWYYNDVIELRDHRDQDRLIVGTIGMAFHRPAFTDPLSNEHFDDLLQALKDTQFALRTGELVDRETRHVIRKSVGGWRYLNEPDWKDRLQELDGELHHLRALLIAGMKDGRLEQRRGYLEVNDQGLGRDLDRRRRRCLERINDALVHAGLPVV